MIQVTKPFFPPLDEYQKYLQQIWKNEWITNNGPFVVDLEKKLKTYLSLDNLLFVSNGTIALQIAIKALELKGEVITTPFSYVATSSSIVWENCTPVFADIDPDSFNISPEEIEKKISNNTSAIIATHVFGNPCNVEEIEKIARKHNLKIIYDAAHCFGTKLKGSSIFKWGDVSTASFHATKIYHSVEGGALIANDYELVQRMEYMRNFGHDGPYKFNGVGINGKNSELHAVMGVLNLKFISEILAKRKSQYFLYKNLLKDLNLQYQVIHEDAEINYSYFPILFKNEKTTIRINEGLAKEQIFARRYFYPSLNTLSFLNGEAQISEDIASRVLCLPLYHLLSKKEQQKIVSVIRNYI